MTLLKGVEHLTPIRGVPAGHNWLTPQIGVVLPGHPCFYSVVEVCVVI